MISGPNISQHGCPIIHMSYICLRLELDVLSLLLIWYMTNTDKGWILAVCPWPLCTASTLAMITECNSNTQAPTLTHT